jgi:signal transduction histidine kinase/AraC-like DNA-binding protein
MQGYIRDVKKSAVSRWAFLFFLIFLTWVPQGGFCQHDGYKYLKNYTIEDYYLQAQNWSILQDQRGVIYVANHGGVLEYDGVSWRIIEIPNTTARSLAIAGEGTIYVCGTNEIGFLAPNPAGSLQYHSLLDYIDRNDRENLSGVKKTYVAKEGIYFGTEDFIFRWNPGPQKMETAARAEKGHKFKAFFMCQGKLFARQDKIGLMQIVNHRLELIPGGEQFASKMIYMITPYDAGGKNLLIGTMYNGLYLFDGKGMTVEVFPGEVREYVKENQLLHGIRLACGDFALATLRGGVIIAGREGNLKYKFNKAYGLQDDDVKYVFEDLQGNLWLGLSKGISKIEYGTPISVFDDRSRLPGLVLSVVKHHNDLYAGTTRGLYILSSPQNKFRPVRGVPTNCYALISLEDTVLAATEGGVFQVVNVKGNEIKRLEGIAASSYFLLPSTAEPGRIWVGTSKGLVSLHREKDGQWSKEFDYEKINHAIKTMVEDREGNLWLGTSPQGVLNVPFSSGKISPDVIPIAYDKSDKLPPGEIQVFMALGQVLFGTDKGLFFFDKEKKIFRPDSRFGKEFADGSQEVFRLIDDNKENIWFNSNKKNFQAIAAPSGTFTINKKPSIIPPIQVNAIYPDPDGNLVWYATHNGLIRYDREIKDNDFNDFKILIRKVVVNDSQVIFDGYIDQKAKPIFPILPYQERNLRFEFAAPFFLGESSPYYRYRLEGYNDDWSAWTSETKKDYTNLDSGTYTLRVQAKNVLKELDREAIFKFKILAPWTKTWWAFLIYAVVLFLVVFFIVKWRSWKLVQEKLWLEQVVKERTREINDKKQQLETQTVQLQEQSERLKEMDQVKSRFFANISHEFRTPLTLIMGPLEQMLVDNRENEHHRKKHLNLMLRSAQRLLNLINQLLDLSKLDSGKMKLRATRQNIIPFLKGLLDPFYFLAAQRKLGLVFKAEREELTLYFDPEKLEKVFGNLLSNAIKFTGPGGEIRVTVNFDPAASGNFPAGAAVITVADNGRGIPAEQLPLIFDRFYQAGDSGEHDQKGSGIGLALTRELVVLHHGTIEIKSSDTGAVENRGTEFILKFPLGKEHLKPNEITELPGKSPERKKSPGPSPSVYFGDGLDGGEEERISELKENGGKAGRTDSEPDSPGKDIILVVEDSRDVRQYIREPLQPHYTVVEAVDGLEGMEKAKEIVPDLIISDIMMPKADGYELCRVLKKDVVTSHIPIILLTAKASEENIVQGLETGADDYITKPFNTKILMVRIKNLIDLRQQLQHKMKRQMMLQPAEISVSSIDEEFIKELQGTIEKNLADPDFSVEELGKKLYMSRASLYRKLQALTGESPNHFIRNYRLKRAAQLLKENFGNVTEVAFEVGFSSSAYFTKCFKEQFQQLPSSYQASEAG